MRYQRMPIEVESPEELGYSTIRYNLAESSVADQSLGALGLTVPDLTLLYGEHRGNGSLRALVAAGTGLGAEDVLITAGAAGALFIVATTLLNSDSHLVVVRPNYATNLETPRAIGCDIAFVDLQFEEGFRLQAERVAEAITSRTRLISITCPHNPTGTTLSPAELRDLALLAASRGCRLLVDETYRELAFDGVLPMAASLGNHVISISSLSKAYGVPGIRIGWIATQDRALRERFLAAKEQISICGSVVDEWIAEQLLMRRDELLRDTLPEMRTRRDLVAAWLRQEDRLEWVRPEGGVVCLPRMKSEPPGGTAAFYERLRDTHGAYVGPGHWFEMPDTYFRLGYGWPTRSALESGLAGISSALRG
ncbi:MAG: pyridoxal phosphate-dependent aminotransferase [Proteobacteria bacterium]|nr:pyridoxal phosphate-dependent aminotransferase [Pseudomonadota bacterium]